MARNVKSDRICRLEVVPTVKRRDTRDSHYLPVDRDCLDKLGHAAIITRIRFDKPPLSTHTLLLTLFLFQCPAALNVVQIRPGATRMEFVSATMFLCIVFGIDLGDMHNCLSRIGSNCTILAWGRCYIANIAPINGAPLIKELDEERAKKEKEAKNKMPVKSRWSKK